ncbi:MAG: aspartate/glutamate racemase family protein [bacterium]|nr:aspartate/glutamate racemase family protein [bacterium]
MKIGVFDSGIGGEAIAKVLASEFQQASLTVVNDKANVPYGDRSPREVRSLTEAAIMPLLGSDVIVIACNTATSLAIEYLRGNYPDQLFIGIEPMIKPAAASTKTNTIAVCATPATLASKRYKKLVQKYGAHLEIIEPDCSAWAYLIENNLINKSHVEAVITDVCKRGADQIVLGCTHYHWIKQLIESVAGQDVAIIEPSQAIVGRVKSLLKID